MRISIAGGGPAGLYFAILMKRLDPAHQITVIDRDAPGDTFGWGIVFSDQTFNYLLDSDPISHAGITAGCQIWDKVVVVHRGERVAIGGNRFSGIARVEFLRILQDRCAELKVDVRYRTVVSSPDDLPPCDLLVGADGANSVVRRAYRGVFRPEVRQGRNKFIWLGTPQLFDGLTLTFEPVHAGLFVAHSYRFSDRLSTFIVECGEETWARAGFEHMDERETCGYLQAVFERALDGQALLANNFVRWLNFPLVRNEHWSGRRVVLLGDALHTAHFSIGSGTRLALEDSIALARSLAAHTSMDDALAAFEAERRPQVERLQAAAEDSRLWFENAADSLHLDPLRFAFQAMTRSGRIDFEKLRKRDPAFVAAYEAAAQRA
jgi:anthraniloyl-CoA monooxygenase